MPRAARGFDRLARVYRALEFLAFGRDLERARFGVLPRLAGCRDILILGEGDGRCLERVLPIAPAARIRCVDASARMLVRAEQRIAAGGAAGHVQFERADARTAAFDDETYDAVLTFFFLDCFRADDVSALVARVQPSLRPGGLWLFADFALPPRGWARLRARVWLALLYRFFRWQTGIDANTLPPSEAILLEAGWRRDSLDRLRGGFVRSAVFTRASAVTQGPVGGCP